MANCDTQSGQLKRSVTSTYESKRHRAPFLAMELVRGNGLDAMLSQGTVTRPDEGAWSAQICDALAHAHDAKIIHRYIKPSNIPITPSGVAKVLDFGVARAADPYATADRLTQTGFIVGTPPYMAPEQARGLPEPRSDLYAVGCLLFELITGRLPFQAPDTVGYLSAHPTQEARSTAVCCPFPRPSWAELLLGASQADLEAFDFAEPAFRLGFCDFEASRLSCYLRLCRGGLAAHSASCR
ncbi:serine/threonine-protein kinase [Streptomyces sp. NPDC044989]|uniref:serine/threonine-protein kinase n=1 Tax=Streptomyces sp. NPDC044989 TaxID=3154336 RepID=UPI0033BFE68A